MAAIHRIGSGNVNCYIVSEGEQAILIDTGRKKCRGKVLEACRKYHVGLIVLTHGHMDHCQNAAYLADALQIPIAMSRKDMDLIPDNRRQALSAKSFLGKIVLSVSLRSFERDSLEPFEPTIFVEGGDVLDDCGIAAKVIGLPGHTKGSVGIRIGDSLFVGDALMNMFYPTVSMLYAEEREMLESAALISGLGEVTIYFGHGKPKRNRRWAF